MRYGNFQQGYSNANAGPPVMSSRGRVITPTYQLTQDVPRSQLDPDMMGSQRGYIEQRYYGQGYAAPAQAHQGLPSQHPHQRMTQQPYVFQDQPRNDTVFAALPIWPQDNPQPGIVFRQPQQQRQQDQQPQRHQPQHQHQPVQSRRVAPRLEGAPPQHFSWANEPSNGMPPDVLAQSYRPPHGGQGYENLPGGGFGFGEPSGPQFPGNQVQGGGDSYGQPHQERGFQPQQVYSQQSQVQPMYSPPPVRRRLEDDTIHGYGPGGTQLEYPVTRGDLGPDGHQYYLAGGGMVPAQLFQHHHQQAQQAGPYYGGGQEPEQRPFRLPAQDQLSWGPGHQDQHQSYQQQQQRLPPGPQHHHHQLQHSGGDRQTEDEDYDENGSRRSRHSHQKVRQAPPISELTSTRLASHTTFDEFDAYNMTKNYIPRGIVNCIWGDGSIWAIHLLALERLICTPTSACGGRTTLIAIIQTLERKCETAFRALQDFIALPRPVGRAYCEIPYSAFWMVGDLLNYLAACLKVRDQSPGANKLGYLFALFGARASEWEALKSAQCWLAAAKHRSPLGEMDQFLQYDGTEASSPGLLSDRRPTDGYHGGGGHGVNGNGGQGGGGGHGGGGGRSGGGGPTPKEAPKKPQTKQSPQKGSYETLSPEKTARVAAQKALIPEGAKDKGLCLNCGSADHYGDACPHECLRCEDPHVGGSCPKKGQSQKRK